MCTALACCQSTGAVSVVLRKATRPEVGYGYEDVLPHLDSPP